VELIDEDEPRHPCVLGSRADARWGDARAKPADGRRRPKNAFFVRLCALRVFVVSADLFTVCSGKDLGSGCLLSSRSSARSAVALPTARATSSNWMSRRTACSGVCSTFRLPTPWPLTHVHVHGDAQTDVFRKIYMIDPPRQGGRRHGTRRRFRPLRVVVVGRHRWRQGKGLFRHDRSRVAAANHVPTPDPGKGR
jgi:hypothetical protein